jgi:hypothetical protein
LGAATAARALLVLFMLSAAGAEEKPSPPNPAPASDTQSPQPVELRGKVVCLPEEMHARHGTDLPTAHEHFYGFKTADGTYYTLLRTKLSEALFLDERLRQKELLLKGRVLPKSQIFEATSMKSIRDQRVCDLYYYCDICAITAVSPLPCACCQGPMELVEKPL